METELKIAIAAIYKSQWQNLVPEARAKARGKDLEFSIDTISDDFLRYQLKFIAEYISQDQLDQELEHIWDKREDIRLSAVDDCYNSEHGANYDDVDGIEEKAFEYFFCSDPDKYLKEVK
jgi:hypothetical protein